MFKKLIAVFVALTMAACAAAPVYADSETVQGATVALAPLEGIAEIEGNGENEKADDKSAEESKGTNEAEEVTKTETTEEVSKTEKKDTSTKQSTKKKSKKKKVSDYQKGLAAYIRSKNSKLSKKWSITLAGYFIKSGKKNDIDPKVLMGLALRESNFRAKATSRFGYKGMMQCGDAFARSYGYKPSDLYKADVSIEIAARYLKTMKKRHKSYSKAICCYVCGSGAVARGTHSREPGRSVMKVRKRIQTFLEKNGYV